MSKTYITTAIPYVNGAPHIGHALDYLLADTYARYAKLRGETVRFQVGTDEHGNKIADKAAASQLSPQAFVDQNSATFKDFIHALGVEYTDFIRTTDPHHIASCQQIWQQLQPHIYKSTYTGWYCTGCEGYATDTEYKDNNGICPDHQKPYERLSEENYYLRLSDFKPVITAAIKSGRMRILPDFRATEILKLIDSAPDVSISRPRANLNWGIPVPGDEDQVMYVWIDALTNYLTVLGYPDSNISDFWPATIQFVGKDILRFHAIIWPAILLGLGLELPHTIHSHGHILSGGKKMGKSLGNVVDPLTVLNSRGLDPFRYFFLRHIDTFTDSDFTPEKFETAYQKELGNDLGNLVQRLATLASKAGLTAISAPDPSALPTEYLELMDSLHFSRALDYVWSRIIAINQAIDTAKPWATIKTDPTSTTKILSELITDLLSVSVLLLPFLPDTSTKITGIFTTSPITPPTTPLFPR